MMNLTKIVFKFYLVFTNAINKSLKEALKFPCKRLKNSSSKHLIYLLDSESTKEQHFHSRLQLRKEKMLLILKEINKMQPKMIGIFF